MQEQCHRFQNIYISEKIWLGQDHMLYHRSKTRNLFFKSRIYVIHIGKATKKK